MPTAKDAVLNAVDLENMLASGNVMVATTGSGAQAKDITVEAPVSWNSGSGLALDAYRSITIEKPTSVQGLAALTLTTNDGGTGGTLSFSKKGNVTFANLSSDLVVNGTTFTLENSIQSLAAAIAANPSGAFALANSYDASQDGTYSASPVPTPFTGTFEGLGNTISRLAMVDSNDPELGLFSELDGGGTLRDIKIENVNVKNGYMMVAYAGSLVAYVNTGNVIGDSSSGKIQGEITADQMYTGGLVGFVEFGLVTNSHSSATVSLLGTRTSAGGLVGWCVQGSITLSSASGSVSGENAGGLVGGNYNSTINQDYSTGQVKGQAAGGLIGEANASVIADSYATGNSKGPQSTLGDNVVGGFVGTANEAASLSTSYSTGKATGAFRGQKGGFVGHGIDAEYSDDYWDTTTSSTKRGVGDVKHPPGVTGLSTTELQSGLPPGFNSTIWGEDALINGGLPYLLANAPLD